MLPPKAADSIEAAVSNFYVALNALFRGESEPMLAVWSQADDIIYMGPDNGLHTGWEVIQAIWVRQAALKLGGEVHASDMHYFVGEVLAIVQNYEVGANVDKAGNPIQVKIRATNVFRKTDGAWEMISHHTDLLSFLND